MTKREAQLRAALIKGVDNYDRSFNNADAPLVPPSPSSGRNSLRLGAAWGNPSFTAQFDVTVLIKYFTVSGGVFTERTAAYVLANAPTLATKLPVFLFGNTDFAAGYAKLQTQYTPSVWAYNAPFVYGKDYARTNTAALDSTASALLQNGDLVLPFSATVSGPVTYNALVIVRCAQVPYATLLGALASDKFAMNMLRYVIDTTNYGTAQFNNAIGVYRETLFGKFDSDTVSPTSFKQPDQQQAGIIDLPIEKGIDKSIALATNIDYNVVQIQWSFFVMSVEKLTY